MIHVYYNSAYIKRVRAIIDILTAMRDIAVSIGSRDVTSCYDPEAHQFYQKNYIFYIKGP